MIARHFIKKINEFEAEFIENVIELEDSEREKLLSRIVNKLPLDQKKDFLNTLRNPQNQRKMKELINSLIELENFSKKRKIIEQIKNIENMKDLLSQLRKFIQNLDIKQQIDVLLENLIIIKESDKKKEIIKFLIDYEFSIRRRILNKKIDDLDNQKREAFKQLENNRNKKRKEEKDSKKRQKIDLKSEERKSKVLFEFSRRKKSLERQIVNLNDQKRREGITNNLANIKDPKNFAKKIGNQTGNIRKIKNISFLIEKIFSINNSEYFRGEIVKNLILSDISKKRKQIIKEFIILNQRNSLYNKNLTINVKLERLDHIKKILMRYNNLNYLDALERIYTSYHKKETKVAINEIKPLIHSIERSLGEEGIANVREHPETINRYIREYEEYCNRKITQYLNLQDIFESILGIFFNLNFPDLKAQIKMHEIKKKTNPNWHNNYKEYLLEYKRIKPSENMYLPTELKTIKEILHILLSEGREFLKDGFWKGTIFKCDEASGIIEDYWGIYYLGATQIVINKLYDEAVSSSNQF